jgi:hypothetical protein
MDTFIEKIIVRKKTAKDYLIIAGVLLGGLVLFFALQLVTFLRPFFIIVTASFNFI